MALDFPSSPTTGQSFTDAGSTWTWDGTKWVGAMGAVGITGTPANGQWAQWSGASTITGVATAAMPFVETAGDTMTGALTLSVDPQLKFSASGATKTGRLLQGGDVLFFGATDANYYTIELTTGLSTFSGDLLMSKADPTITLNKAASGQANTLQGKNNGLLRWLIQFGNGTAESGSNIGSDLNIIRCSDVGSVIDAPFSIARSTGEATFRSNVTVTKTGPAFIVDATGASDDANFTFQDGGAIRWSATMVGASTDFAIRHYNDAQVLQPTTIYIRRADGVMALGRSTNTSIFDATANINIKYNDGILPRGINIMNVNSSLANAIIFYNGSLGFVGAINTDNTSTTYATASDVRLKTDLAPFTRGREMLDQITVQDFTWRANGERDTGVIAQDVERVFPKAVARGRGEPGDADFVPYGIDNSRLVPILIQALQDAFKEIDALKAQVTPLER